MTLKSLDGLLVSMIDATTINMVVGIRRFGENYLKNNNE